MKDEENSAGLRDEDIFTPKIYENISMEAIEEALKNLTKQIPTNIVYTSTNFVNQYFPEYKLPENYPCVIKF